MVNLSAGAIGVLYRKLSTVLPFLTFSSTRFAVFGFMLRSLIYLHYSTCRHPVRPPPFIAGDFSYSLCISDFFIKNEVFIGMRFMSGSSSGYS